MYSRLCNEDQVLFKTFETNCTDYCYFDSLLALHFFFIIFLSLSLQSEEKPVCALRKYNKFIYFVIRSRRHSFEEKHFYFYCRLLSFSIGFLFCLIRFSTRLSENYKERSKMTKMNIFSKIETHVVRTYSYRS